jgi:DNA-binding NarL/FixJ family response regulator
MKSVQTRSDKSRRKIRIVLASDSNFFIEGMRKILQSTGEISILAQASEYREIEKYLARIKPQFLFVDNRMLKLDITKLLLLKNGRSHAKKVIVLDDDKEERTYTALNLVYITKETNSSELIKIIRDTSPGKGAFREQSNPKEARLKLTQKQLKIIELIANGLTNKEIANEFSISEKTVKAHLTSIFAKLGLQNRYQLQLMVYTTHLSSKVG